MPKSYSEIKHSAYTVGNIMDWTNALTRLSGVPVDITEVYDSFDEAVIYAAENAVAYEGQVITVTEGGDTTVYVITPRSQGTHVVGEGDDAVTYTVYIKKVGTVPTGDGKSVDVDENGIVTLHGFQAAPDAALPQKKADGTIEWVTIDAVVQGDGNTKAEVKSSDGSITVTKTHDDETDTYTYDISVFGIEERLGKVEDFFKTAEGETLDQALDTLIEIQKYIDSDGQVAEQVLTNEKAIETLNGDSTVDGSVDKKIADATSNFVTTQTLADYLKTEDASNTYATKESVYDKDAIAALIGTPGKPAVKDEEGNVTTEAIAGSGVYQHVYSKDEVTNLIADITGGQSASDVLAALTAYETKNDARVKKVEDAINALVSSEDSNLTVREIAAAEINALIGAADEEDSISDIATLIEYVNANGSSITELTASVSNLTTKVDTGELTVTTYVADAIADNKLVGSEEVIISDDNKLGIGTINIDKITQTAGTRVVLHGGSANA